MRPVPARDRVDDGVRYVHIGLGVGGFTRLLTYFVLYPARSAALGLGPGGGGFQRPVLVGGRPWIDAGRPVIGVVQWLFAREKAAQYHLPFHLVKHVGLRSHRRLIAVSDDLAGNCGASNPRAEVTVVPNGLNDGNASFPGRPRRDIAFLGRLDIAQKGLDLLWPPTPGWRTRSTSTCSSGGTGPDEARLRRLTADLDLSRRVHFVGRIPTDERLSWLASADVVAMPSRYETFGMVAAEGLAVSTPSWPSTSPACGPS